MSLPSASSALGTNKGRPRNPQTPRAHRFRDILQVLRTHILKGEIDLPADLTLCVVRDANATRLRNPLKASGDVDAVPKDIVVIDDDVTDVDADAKFDPLDLRHRSICSAIPRWTSMAQRTASTTLPNSASTPSPVCLTTLPRCSLILGSASPRNRSLSRTCVPSSSKPVRRLYPATSAARIAASRR